MIEARREGEQAVIAVSDRGPGVPETERGRVLERFVRLESARSRPGFGLGLSLAAAVARLHGGSLRLEDNTPGLKAVLSLPLRIPASPSIAQSQPSTEPATRSTAPIGVEPSPQRP